MALNTQNLLLMWPEIGLAMIYMEMKLRVIKDKGENSVMIISLPSSLSHCILAIVQKNGSRAIKGYAALKAVGLTQVC